MSAEKGKKRSEDRVRLTLNKAEEKRLRWSELVKESGLSERTLSKRLRDLEGKGIVKRIVDAETREYPPPVYYELVKELDATDILFCELKRIGIDLTEEDLKEGKRKVARILEDYKKMQDTSWEEFLEMFEGKDIQEIFITYSKLFLKEPLYNPNAFHTFMCMYWMMRQIQEKKFSKEDLEHMSLWSGIYSTILELLSKKYEDLDEISDWWVNKIGVKIPGGMHIGFLSMLFYAFFEAMYPHSPWDLDKIVPFGAKMQKFIKELRLEVMKRAGTDLRTRKVNE